MRPIPPHSAADLKSREDEARGTLYRLRQSGIDEELFDVMAGFETLAGR
jgi:F0F1-type ATP synthase gamma subunit